MLNDIFEKKVKKHISEARKNIVGEYKEKLMQQTSIFSKVNKDNEQSLAASYEVFLQLAKANKQFCNGVFTNRCSLTMAQRFM